MIDARLNIIIDAINGAQNELRQLKEDLGAVEKPAKKAGISLTDLKSGIDMVIGGARTFAKVVKTAFDLTEQGASIMATRSSFESLGFSIESLRQKAGGTIDDMTLMSGALTTVAGTSGTLEAAMRNAYPQFIEIARAANKLNPSLGDTSYMLDSITLAAKRQSKLIADNLGIIVNQTSANEKYAESIGKAVDELTDEEQQLAFVNGLLESGNDLIRQSGDTVDGEADAWARVRAEIQNAIDAKKEYLAEKAQPFVEATADHLEVLRLIRDGEIAYSDAIRDTGAELGTGIVVYKELDEVLAIIAEKREDERRNTELLTSAQEQLHEQMARGVDVTKDAAKVQFQVTDAMKNQYGVVINSATAFDQYNRAAGNLDNVRAIPSIAVPATRELANLGDAVGELGRKFASFDTGTNAMWNMILETGRAAGLTAEQLGNLAVEMGIADQSQVDATLAAEGLVKAYENRLINENELVKASGALATADALIAENQNIMKESGGNLTQQQQEQIEKNERLIENAIALAERMGETGASINLVRDAEIQAAEKADLLKSKLAELDGTTVGVNFQFNIPALPNIPGVPTQREQAYAAGGVSSGGLGWVGESGPEMTQLPPGTRVYDHHTSRVVTNNFNLTANLSGNKATLRNSFAIMQALGA